MQSALTDFFVKQADIRLAILFGSAATDRLKADSDVDVAVLTVQALSAQRKIELISALALITGRPIDLIDLQTAGQPLLGQIIQGKRLKGSTDLFAQLAYRNLIERSDFLPLIQRSLEQRRRAWIQA